jgi:hypothetical protein
MLQALALNKTFVEVHSYIGDNRALFNSTLAAYLVAFGEGAYFGAGNTWDTCESWLIDYQIETYMKPLGEPDGVATSVSTQGGTQYTRKFSSGTHVQLWVSDSTVISDSAARSDSYVGSDSATRSDNAVRGSSDASGSPAPPPRSCVWWSDGSTTGNAC